MTKKILVVDDSAALRQVVNIALQDSGYDIIEACDGKEALDQLNGQKIDLIISDVSMPHMDGISFVKQARVRAEYKFTPVIMLTSLQEKEKAVNNFAASVKAWMVKPFQPVEMLTLVSSLIRH
jgi:two-component system chemotaxis response regulator CheY